LMLRYSSERCAAFGFIIFLIAASARLPATKD